jgi:hypothetical protein
MSYSLSVTIDDETATGSGETTETFKSVIALPAGASDTSLTLGTITDPLYIAVFGGEGISFKLGAAGTDEIGANPVGVVSDEQGLGETVVLLSNDSGVEVEVAVLAAE